MGAQKPKDETRAFFLETTVDSRGKKRRSTQDFDFSSERVAKKARVIEKHEARPDVSHQTAKTIVCDKAVDQDPINGSKPENPRDPIDESKPQDPHDSIDGSKPEDPHDSDSNNNKIREAYQRWSSDEKFVSIPEEIRWLKNFQDPIKNPETFDNWTTFGAPKKTIDAEITFCDANIAKKIVNVISMFNGSSNNEAFQWESPRSNPRDTIPNPVAYNRDALKMADIDRDCGLMFTEPQSHNPKEFLYFADVSSGSRGFSEYLLRCKQWHAVGFGFAGKKSNDCEHDEFPAGPSDSFHRYYGKEGNGVLCNLKNQEDFVEFVRKRTRGRGVHVMMAGGDSIVEGQESVREILSKQAQLCQCLVALMILRQYGNFVMKFYDTSTRFSAGLIYLMYRCFESILIHKPESSDFASSERYLICKEKKANVRAVIDYLRCANFKIEEKNEGWDIIELVPLGILQDDARFSRYLTYSNERWGLKQIDCFLYRAGCCDDDAFDEFRQIETTKNYPKYWDLQEEERERSMNEKPGERISRIFGKSRLPFICSKSTQLKPDNIEKTILSMPFDWVCVPCASDGRTDDEKAPTLYLSLGRTKCFRFFKGAWIHVNDLELPAQTLVYAEMVVELTGEREDQQATLALHIIDAYQLGQIDVSQRYLEDRLKLTKLFLEAVRKPETSRTIRCRVKELLPLSRNLEEKLVLKPRVLANGVRAEAYVLPRDSSHHDDNGNRSFYYLPNSIVFLKGTALNWSRHLGKKRLPYYYNRKDNVTMFDQDKPDAADAPFLESYVNRVTWHWQANSLSLESILSAIEKACLPPTEESEKAA